jgi:hypothetical protein
MEAGERVKMKAVKVGMIRMFARGRVEAGGADADAAGSTAVRESGESGTEGAEGMDCRHLVE